MEIIYKDKKYKLETEGKDYLIFALDMEDIYKQWPLKDVAIELSLTREELEMAQEEYKEYEERVDEFAYCGYTEEDPDFHGMVLHLNTLEDEVRETKKKEKALVEAIKYKTRNMNEAEFDYFLMEYDLDW